MPSLPDRFRLYSLQTGIFSEEVMKSRILLIAACFFLFTAVASPVWADTIYPMVKLTVKQSVDIPGHVLSPGQYYVANVDTSSNVVLIRNADGTQSFYELVGHAIRQKPANGVVVDVSRNQQGRLPRILDYFYPGNTYGTAFLYPVHPSVKLARKLVPRSQAG
jgi:hypothetical protein